MTDMTPMTDADWHALAQGRYLNLESYRRDGRPLRTPLWFAADGATLVAYTRADTGKIKRLRRNPACRIAACDMRGTPTGPWLAAQARLLDGAEADAAMRLLDRKYWPWKQLIALFALLRPAPRAVIALTPTDRPPTTP
jgi:PPOX class probable F420-dependent enzyme